jgi:hypothetical protein
MNLVKRQPISMWTERFGKTNAGLDCVYFGTELGVFRDS